MDNNLLACLDPLMAHIGQIDGIKAVFSAQEFAELGRKRQPHHGAVYVVFDSLTPTENVSQSARLNLSVMVVLVLSQLTTSIEDLGKQMSRVIGQINGYRPTANPTANPTAYAKGEAKTMTQALTATPFVLKNSINAKYIDGFIYLPMSFEAQVISV